MQQLASTASFRTGIALAAVGAIAFSGKAIIVKLAYRYEVDPVTLIMYRMLFALPLFLLMAWWAGRGKPALERRDWLSVVGLGFIGYYLSSFLDFWGLQYISASLERLIMYLAPTMVLLLSWCLYKKPIAKVQVLAIVIGYAGVCLVFGREMSVAGTQVALGALLVFLSATLYALYMIFSGQVVIRLGALRLAGLATSVACLLCLLQFFLLKPMTALQVPTPVLWLSMINATLCTALPVLLVMMGIERIGAGLTAQVGMIGPVSTIAMGVLLLGEPLTRWVIAGTLLVMLGVYLVTQFSSAKNASSNDSQGNKT